MDGGSGDDHYIVDDAGDSVVELADAGFDTVTASVSHELAENVEKLILVGDANASALGNSLDNEISGDDSDNHLSGSGGDDIIRGGGGNDIISGGSGNDQAIFDGVMSEYLIQKISGIEWRITYLNTNDGDNGSDQIQLVEQFVFDDETVNVEMGLSAVGAPVQVNTTSYIYHVGPSVAAAPNGNYVVVWQG